MAAKKKKSGKKGFEGRVQEGRAKMFFLEAEIKQRRKLQCPMCGRNTEASVDPKKVTYCSVCVGKFYETMGLKPMVDLGPATQIIGMAVTDYAKGKVKASF